MPAPRTATPTASRAIGMEVSAVREAAGPLGERAKSAWPLIATPSEFGNLSPVSESLRAVRPLPEPFGRRKDGPPERVVIWETAEPGTIASYEAMPAPLADFTAVAE